MLQIACSRLLRCDREMLSYTTQDLLYTWQTFMNYDNNLYCIMCLQMSHIKRTEMYMQVVIDLTALEICSCGFADRYKQDIIFVLFQLFWVI